MNIDSPAPVRAPQAPPPDGAATPCRYRESQPRSAELLRLVLAWMGKHDAAFHSVTFAVWYEHVAGRKAKRAAKARRCYVPGGEGGIRTHGTLRYA